MLELRRLSDWSEAEPYREAWNALVLARAGGVAAAPSVYQTYEWNHAWWQAFGKNHELLLLAAFDGEELVGVAPLMISRLGGPVPGRVVRIMGGHNFASDYCAFISAAGREDVLNGFVDWLEAHPGLWNELEFMNVEDCSEELSIMRQRFEARGVKMELAFLYDAPTRDLGGEAENKELVGRQSLRRHTNWFQKQGVLTLRHCESEGEILGALDHFFEQHMGRRAVTEAPSQFADENQRQFFRLLVPALFSKGWLRFFKVELNGVAVAYHFGFEFAGKFYWYKPSFDVQYSKKSPGEVLLKALFEYSIAANLKEFDFTAGSEAFKYRFSNRTRKLYKFRVFRNWSRYALHRLGTRSRAVARRVLRRAPTSPKSELAT